MFCFYLLSHLDGGEIWVLVKASCKKGPLIQEKEKQLSDDKMHGRKRQKKKNDRTKVLQNIILTSVIQIKY